MQYEIISHARTTNLRKLRKLGCARFSAYLDQYITSIAQLRLYMQYEIISHARTTKKYEIKLSCARFSVCLDHYITTFAQLRLYCIHVRATQSHEKDENWSARASKIGLRALQCVPGLIYNADRAAAFMQYEIISHARTTNIRKLRKLGCARFSAYLDQYITSITQLRLYMQYEIISQAHTTKKYEIKLSCAYTFAQLRLYCIHLRATHAGARTSKLGCAHFSAYLDQYITPIAQLRSPVPGPSVCAGKAPEPLSIAAL